jgi:undecaprenyl diphosphate synthase
MSVAESQSPPQNKPIPRHVAIIMDGNGRWARAHGLPREEGHRQGVENVKRIVRCARDMDLRYLTLYAFSVENWNRPRREVQALMRLLESFLKAQARELIEKRIRLKVLGRIDDLPDRVARMVRRTVDDTRHFSNWTLALALNYGSRTEIVDAVKAYAGAVQAGREDPARLDWDRLSGYLHTAGMPDPDLVIRTSGEHRLSNFLLLQSAYAEYYFATEYWPDFGTDCLHRAIEAYRRRERRFGLTSEQLKAETR